MVTARHVGYVTEDKDKFKKIKNTYKHVVFLDQTKRPIIQPIKVTQALHRVARYVNPHKQDKSEWKVKTALMPCSCQAYRNIVDQPCPYGHIKGDNEVVMKEEIIDEEELLKRNMEKAKLNAFQDRVRTILGEGVPYTNTSLKKKLQELGLPQGGKK